LTKLRPFAALSVVRNTGRLILCGGVVTLFLVFGMSQDVYANENQEQVIVSPAQQTVNTALSTATTEVQQAIDATANAAVEVSQAQTELTQAQAAVSDIASAITVVQDKVSVVESATTTLLAIDPETTELTQSSEVIVDVKTSVINATNAVTNLTTEISQAQTEVSQVATAKATAVTAQSTAQTELTQANLAIDAAQTAVNNLQATIGTSTNVLAGIDDAGVLMTLPFDLLMGGVLYDNVYVGSNATITFGVNEGANYYSTPNAPSISIAGWDWTTWSTGTGITYATTESTLDIAWDLRPFPQQDASTQMVQVRFNADVNPVNGAWNATVSAVGPIPNGARFNYRETAGGAVTEITDTNVGASFAGQISQGPEFTPIVNNNIAGIQAAVDAANATIFQLNQNLSPVVSQNTLNTSNINSINTTSLTNTINSAIATKTTLESNLNIKAAELTAAISLLPEDVVVPEPQPSPQPQPEPIFGGVPDFQPEFVEPPVETVLDVPVEEEIQPTPEPETVLEPEPEVDLEPAPEPELTPDDSSETSLEEQESIVNELSNDGELSESDAEAVLDALSSDGEITQEEVTNLAETLSEDGEFTEAERELVAEALIESAEGEAVTAEAIEEAGLTYEDLPAETPVEVRQDENGNEVIITAEVAAALTVLESPAEFIGAIFDDPGQALTAVLNIGADMSVEEREESEKIIVAAVIAGQAAINAATMAATGAATTAAVSAATTATGSTTPSNSGGAGGPAAGNDKPKRTFRRRAK